MNWHYSGSSTTSASKLNDLVHNVLLDADFRCEDLKGFDAEREGKRLDNFNAQSGTILTPNEKWIEASVPISLPPPKKGSYVPEARAPIYEVEGLIYRNLLEVIKSAFSEPAAVCREFPYRTLWGILETRSWLSSCSSIFRVIQQRCLYPGAGKTSRPATYWWSRASHCGYHVMVGFYAPDIIWQCFHVADLHVSWKSLKVHTMQANFFLGPSLGLYSEGNVQFLLLSVQ